MGTPLHLKVKGPFDKPVIKITETDDNHFVIGADYVEDQDENRLYVSSRGSDWQKVQEDILTLTAGGLVGIGVEDPDYKLQVNGATHSLSFVNMSDEKYKKDIRPIKNALEKVKEIEGVTFEWNAGTYPYDAPEGVQIGLIAQQVEQVVPDVISAGKNGDKSISYDRLVPLLIEAVKEQQKIIDDLKEEVENINKLI